MSSLPVVDLSYMLCAISPCVPTGWQPRWFVLESGILSYYLSQEEVKNGSRGSFKVAMCNIKGMYIRIYTYIRICVPKYIRTYVLIICISMYVCMCTHNFNTLSIYTDVLTGVCMCPYVGTYVHLCIPIHKYKKESVLSSCYTYVRTYMHTVLFSFLLLLDIRMSSFIQSPGIRTYIQYYTKQQFSGIHTYICACIHSQPNEAAGLSHIATMVSNIGGENCQQIVTKNILAFVALLRHISIAVCENIRIYCLASHKYVCDFYIVTTSVDIRLE